MTLTVHASQILPRLWVGDEYACGEAREMGFKTLCVLETPCQNDGCDHIAICECPDDGRGWALAARPQLIQAAVDWVADRWRQFGNNVLVHCAAGIERSPLTMAYYLSKHFGLDLDESYDWLKAHRPIVVDRRAWISEE